MLSDNGKNFVAAYKEFCDITVKIENGFKLIAQMTNKGIK